jgi:hypothetical protein
VLVHTIELVGNADKQDLRNVIGRTSNYSEFERRLSSARFSKPQADTKLTPRRRQLFVFHSAQSAIDKQNFHHESNFSHPQIPETEGASLAASHSVGFCEVSVAENSPNLYKVFEKLLIESRARPVKPRKFSVSKMIGKLNKVLASL